MAPDTALSMEAIEAVRRLLPDREAFGERVLAGVLSAFRLYHVPRRGRLQVSEQGPVEAIVARGCLRVYFLEPDGAERVLYFAPEGWCVTGLETPVFDRPIELNVDAVDPTEAWLIDRVELARVRQEHPECERILRLIAENSLARLQQRLVGGLRKSAAQRYADFHALYPSLEGRIPQYHIAAYLGISPEFLSKMRKRIREG